MLWFFALFLAALIFPWAPPPGVARDNLRSTVQDTAVADLPKEAGKTLDLIKEGGPFPYPRDGAVFGNFERRLPLKERGYYREYTVPTPRSRDRGPRRIVAGRNDEYYYTGDHYRTFHRIRE
jgi:ribonuclease T1